MHISFIELQVSAEVIESRRKSEVLTSFVTATKFNGLLTADRSIDSAA